MLGVRRQIFICTQSVIFQNLYLVRYLGLKKNIPHCLTSV